MKIKNWKIKVQRKNYFLNKSKKNLLHINKLEEKRKIL